MSAPRSHGARSQATVARRSAYVQQSILKRLGLRQRDLEPALRYRFIEWSKAQALVDLYDAWANEHGAFDESGRPPAFSATWHAARNSAARLFRSLESDLLKASAAKQADGGTELERHLARHYGDGKAKS
jgi:hypothetical protein